MFRNGFPREMSDVLSGCCGAFPSNICPWKLRFPALCPPPWLLSRSPRPRHSNSPPFQLLHPGPEREHPAPAAPRAGGCEAAAALARLRGPSSSQIPPKSVLWKARLLRLPLLNMECFGSAEPQSQRGFPGCKSHPICHGGQGCSGQGQSPFPHFLSSFPTSFLFFPFPFPLFLSFSFTSLSSIRLFSCFSLSPFLHFFSFPLLPFPCFLPFSPFPFSHFPFPTFFFSTFLCPLPFFFPFSLSPFPSFSPISLSPLPLQGALPAGAARLEPLIPGWSLPCGRGQDVPLGFSYHLGAPPVLSLVPGLCHEVALR